MYSNELELNMNIEKVIIKQTGSDDDISIPVIQSRDSCNLGTLYLSNYKKIKHNVLLIKELIKIIRYEKHWKGIGIKDIIIFMLHERIFISNEMEKFITKDAIVVVRDIMTSPIVYNVKLYLFGDNYSRYNDKIQFKFKNDDEHVGIESFLELIKMTYGNKDIKRYIIKVNDTVGVWISKNNDKYMEIFVRTRLTDNKEYKSTVERILRAMDTWMNRAKY